MRLSDLQPDTKNARRRDARANKAIQHSLSSLGFGRSVCVDKHDRIISGNGVVTSALALKTEDEVQVIDSDGSKLVVVRRTDLDMSDPRARELALADNAVALLATWDSSELKDMSTVMDMSVYFTPAELADLKIIDTPDPEPPVGLMQEPGLFYRVIVDCDGEQQQAAIMTELEGRGIPCRLLIS